MAVINCTHSDVFWGDISAAKIVGFSLLEVGAIRALMGGFDGAKRDLLIVDLMWTPGPWLHNVEMG